MDSVLLTWWGSCVHATFSHVPSSSPIKGHLFTRRFGASRLEAMHTQEVDSANQSQQGKNE